MAEDKKILYRPSIEPQRHFESDGQFKKKITSVPDPIPYYPEPEEKKSETDELLADLKMVYDLLPFMPIPIRPIIETMIVTITTDTIIRIDPPDPETPLPPEPKDPNKFIPVPTPEPDLPEPKVNPEPLPKDDSDLDFPNVPIVDVPQEKSQELDRLVYRWTKRNLVRVKKHWIEKLKDYLQDYLSKMFNAVQLCGAEDITILLLAFDALAVKTTSGKKCKVAHDSIVRNDLLIREKAKLMAKLYSADELIRFMRAIEAAAQTRQEYYNHDFLSYCPTMLSQYENDMLRSYRGKYDEKYVNAVYQYNKLLVSSAELSKEVFNLTAENAMAKGVLINNGINPFEKTPTPDPIFYLNTLAPEAGKIGANGLSSTGNYGNLKPGAGSTSSSGGNGTVDAVNLKGNDKVQKMWNFFKDMGYDNNAIAGIMGNIQQESQFSLGITEDGSGSMTPGVGFGLVQWTDSERQGLLSRIASQLSKQPSDLEAQLATIKYEIMNTHTGAKPENMNGKTIEQAVSCFTGNFEYQDGDGRENIPEVAHGKRVGYAQNIYNNFAK